MASWIVHLRIADALLDVLDVEASHFLAGNIAPDCGRPVPAGGFDPDLHVTHFTKTKKDACEYDRFWNEYGSTARTPAQRSFYLGYFAHLMTDVLWVKWINAPTKARFPALYRENRKEYYRLVKADWYDQDFLFLQKNPDFRSFRLFSGIPDYTNDWLPFYDSGNLPTQFAHIIRFYQEGQADPSRDYPYLTASQTDWFVENAVAEILKSISDICTDCTKDQSDFLLS